MGPLDPRSFPSIHCSPIGLVPKGATGKWRLIVDLSSPHDRSVNDGIDPALCLLEYVTVDVVADVVVGLPGSLLSKIDVRSAYRTVPFTLRTGGYGECHGKDSCLWTRFYHSVFGQLPSCLRLSLTPWSG